MLFSFVPALSLGACLCYLKRVRSGRSLPSALHVYSTSWTIMSCAPSPRRVPSRKVRVYPPGLSA